MIEHIVYFYLRTVLNRSWNELMRATHDPSRTQSSRLLDIVSRNRDSSFGREHGFSGLKSVGNFRERVPVRTYEEFEPYVKRICRGEKKVLTTEEPEMFGRTSGSTGEPKFIPVTPSFYEEFSKMQKMWQRKLAGDHKEMIRGKILSVMSPEVDGYTECGIPYGAISGHSYRLQYPLTQARYAVPYDVMCSSNFDAKYYLALRLALEQNVTAIAAMNPSTILLLMKKLNHHAGALARDIAEGTIRADLDIDPRLRTQLEGRVRPNKKRARELEVLADSGRPIRGTDIWKNLAIIIAWQGGSVGYFLREFPKYFPGIPVRDMGLIATEGYFSIPLESNTPAGLLAVTGHFFEFFEVKDDGGRGSSPLECDQLEAGKEYYIVVTTSGGLYRYDICDIIEVVGFYNKTPLIVFKQKGGNTISITGEKLTEVQVTESMGAATASLAMPVEGFALALKLADPPCYTLAVETPERNEVILTELLAQFERELRLRNIEYAAKRDSQRLGPPSLCLLEPGFFEECRKSQVKRGAPDGQFKISHVVSDISKLGDVRPVAEIAMPATPAYEKRLRA